VFAVGDQNNAAGFTGKNQRLRYVRTHLEDGTKTMAELHVERKKHHVWPWVLGLLALAIIIWAIAANHKRDNDVAQVAPATTSSAAVAATPADTTATQGATATTDTPATDPSATTGEAARR
jgi:hypothetical protein